MRRIGLLGGWLLAPLLGVAAHAASVSPSNPNLQYITRWEDSSPSQPWAYAQGSSIIASFTGTSIEATFGVSNGEYFRVILDDDADASAKVSFSSGVPMTLASGLAPGVHKLELVKATDVGRATLLGLEIDDGEAIVASPPRPARRIVSYGDSNLAGYSLESERNQGGSKTPLVSPTHPTRRPAQSPLVPGGRERNTNVVHFSAWPEAPPASASRRISSRHWTNVPPRSASREAS